MGDGLLSRADVLALLSRLEASGLFLSLTPKGDGVRLSGVSQPAPGLVEEVKSAKSALLAYLRGEALPGEEEGAAEGQGPKVAEVAGNDLILQNSYSKVQREREVKRFWENGVISATSATLPEAARLPSSPEDLPEEEKARPSAGKCNEAAKGPLLATAADVEEVRRLSPSPLPDWEAIGAQWGHCGSCARASDASEEWGALMVTCDLPAHAFEAGLKPLALHIGHRCAAYVSEGEKVGGGYRPKRRPEGVRPDFQTARRGPA